CSLFLLIACTEEEPIETIPTNTNRLLSVEVDWVETTRFYYLDDQLTEVQEDYFVLDQQTQAEIKKTDSYLISYEAGKVIEVNSDNRQIHFEYLENDLVLTTLVNQAVFSKVTYEGYQNPSNVKVTAINEDQLSATFKLTFDEHNNFLQAVNEADLLVEEAYPGYYLVSPFNGIHIYDDKKNPYSDFAPELQLWLTQKMNPNNVIERQFALFPSTRYFEYTYNSEAYPVSKTTTVLDHTTNESYTLEQTTYVYE
ncbi:MAG: hypothetical protein AAGD05_13135, partial [Bacteroidota bacterium]